MSSKLFSQIFSGLVLLSIFLLLININWEGSVIEPSNGKTTKVDIIPKELVTEPWGYNKTEESKQEIANPDGSVDQTPFAKATVTNIRNGEVADIFFLDARQSNNPISNMTETYWVVDGKRLSTNSKAIHLRLSKDKNHEATFYIVDNSNPEYPIGSAVTFKIPMYDVFYKPSPLDTGVKYDR